MGRGYLCMGGGVSRLQAAVGGGVASWAQGRGAGLRARGQGRVLLRACGQTWWHCHGRPESCMHALGDVTAINTIQHENVKARQRRTRSAGERGEWGEQAESSVRSITPSHLESLATAPRCKEQLQCNNILLVFGVWGDSMACRDSPSVSRSFRGTARLHLAYLELCHATACASTNEHCC